MSMFVLGPQTVGYPDLEKVVPSSVAKAVRKKVGSDLRKVSPTTSL